MEKKQRSKLINDILKENKLQICEYNISMFDDLTDLDLIGGAKEIVKKIKRYEEFMDTDRMKYPQYIMKTIRKKLGLDEKDTSKDLEIYQMDRKDVLDVICKNNGIEENTSNIIRWIEDIYQIKLED